MNHNQPNDQMNIIKNKSTSVQQINNLKREPFPNKKYQEITLPILEMSDPYYPYSHLATSTFYGYYILFFMFSCIFLLVYPILNYLEGDDMFDRTILNLIQTNIAWDIISAALFLFLALIFTKMSVLQLPTLIFVINIVIIFVCGPILIIKSFPMYFTDRIFIVVIGANFGAKTIGFLIDKQTIHDKPSKQNHQFTQIEKQKAMGKISKKIMFLICPIFSYRKFVQEHDPNLPIHARYIFTKFLVSFLCLFVNNILVVKFIEPACQTSLSFIQLLFKLIPLTFYINMVLYYMVFDNILATLAEITQIRYRVFYLDWWNAENIYEFIEKWCLLLTQFCHIVMPEASRRTKATFGSFILIVLLVIVFGRSLNLLSLILFMLLEVGIFFIGNFEFVQNNYIVHILCMSFTPLLISLQIKFGIFN